MEIREFGRSKIPVSRIAFGSMRLDARKTPKDDVVRLFEMLHDRGVTTFHSSYEYDSFDYFCECLNAFRERRPGAQVSHVAKLPAPHFDEDAFSPERFTERIDYYLRTLGAERLDVVQWLVRQTPNTYEPRAKVLAEAAHKVEAIWKQLKEEGKIGALASFPYDPDFADDVLELPACEGLVTYLNMAELDYVHFLDSTSLIAIRPLFAGMLTPEGLAESDEEVHAERLGVAKALEKLGVSHDEAASFAIQFCLMHDNVASAIVGMSSEDHARELLDAAENARTNRQKFDEVVELLSRVKSEA